MSPLPEFAVVWELPEIRPVVTEPRLIPGWCPHCQSWVKPELPAEIGRSASGPRLQAGVAIHPYRSLPPKPPQGVELLQELCGVQVSLGSIQSRCEETSEALETP